MIEIKKGQLQERDQEVELFTKMCGVVLDNRVVEARTIHKFKEMFDFHRYRGRTT